MRQVGDFAPNRRPFGQFGLTAPDKPGTVGAGSGGLVNAAEQTAARLPDSLLIHLSRQVTRALDAR